MFKIRSPQLNDFEKLEVLRITPLQEIVYQLQPLIPPNLRTLPSIHLAVEEKNILGYVILKCASKPNNCWQIEEVFVQDEIRNKGIGEELLRYVLSLYGSHGIEHFLAEVSSQNFPALSLFHECGFRRYAKVCFYEKEIEINAEILHTTSLQENEFILRQQTKSDLAELEKLDLASIPADLRPALGRSKDYFKERKSSIVLIDKRRNLLIGWAEAQKTSNNNYLIELLLSPGWTHLYENFLNTIICDWITPETNKIQLTIKAVDYLTEFTDTLTKLGFLKSEVKELLVRTIWQKVKERKTKTAKIGLPYTAPT